MGYDGTGRPRLTIIVLDLLNMNQLEQTEAKERIANFLEKGLVEDQPVSLVKITSDGLRQIQHYGGPGPVAAGAQENAHMDGLVIWHRSHVDPVIQSLRDIGDAYAGIPGRKSLILVVGICRTAA